MLQPSALLSDPPVFAPSRSFNEGRRIPASDNASATFANSASVSASPRTDSPRLAARTAFFTASSGAQSNHINHVQTQMQYAMVVVIISAVGYVLAGVTKSWFISLAVGAALLIVVLLGLEKRAKAA